MNKKIVLTIVLSIILKNAAFAVGIEGGIDTSSPVIQSAVFQVVSVLNMPLQVVTNIMKEMPLNSSAQPLKGPAEKKGNHSQDTKCLFTLDPKEGSKPKLKAISAGGHGSAEISKCFAGCIEAADKVLYSPWETIICLLVSVFLILIPRRGPPLENSMSSNYTLPNYAFGVIGFFNFRALNMFSTPLITQIIETITQITARLYECFRVNNLSNLFYNPCNRIFGGINEF